MTMKPEQHKPTDHEKKRGGGLGPTKDAHKQHRKLDEDETLDEALDESFPASDPPAQTQPTHVGAKKKSEKKSD